VDETPEMAPGDLSATCARKNSISSTSDDHADIDKMAKYFIDADLLDCDQDSTS